MKWCKNCGDNDKKKEMFEHNKGGFVCDDCLGNYFICPDCGMIFDNEDYEWGDSGNGFCRMCGGKH